MLMRSIIALILTVIMVSCSDEDQNTPSVRVTEVQTPAGTPTVLEVNNEIFPALEKDSHYYFDWESTNTLIDDAGTAFPLPWNPTASISFHQALRNDIAREDGWELLYNSVHPDYVSASATLVLYNKFRGVLRFYYYVKNNAGIPAGNDLTIAHWETEGIPTTALNFNQQVVDLNNTSFDLYQVQPLGFPAGSWVMFEKEVAFDATADQHSTSEVSVKVELTSRRLASLSINDKSAATLPGPLSVEDVGSSYLNVYEGAQEEFHPFLSSRVQSELNEAFVDGNRGSFLNARLGTMGRAQVCVPAQINLLLDIGSSALISSPSFALPGGDPADMVGAPPFYNRILGVFNLAQKPTVLLQEDAASDQPFVYSLQTSSVAYQFNPAVLEVADIEEIFQEIVAINDQDMSTVYRGQELKSNQALNVLGVRVSFKVVPHNGSEPVRIVKTFAADVVSE